MRVRVRWRAVRGFSERAPSLARRCSSRLALRKEPPGELRESRSFPGNRPIAAHRSGWAPKGWRGPAAWHVASAAAQATRPRALRAGKGLRAAARRACCTVVRTASQLPGSHDAAYCRLWPHWRQGRRASLPGTPRTRRGARTRPGLPPLPSPWLYFPPPTLTMTCTSRVAFTTYTALRPNDGQTAPNSSRRRMHAWRARSRRPTARADRTNAPVPKRDRNAPERPRHAYPSPTSQSVSIQRHDGPASHAAQA